MNLQNPIKYALISSIGVVMALFYGISYWQIWAVLALLVTMFLGYIVHQFKLYTSAFFVLATSLPLSIETEFIAGAKLIFPSELIAVVIICALAFRFLQKPKISINKKLLPSLLLVVILIAGALFSTNFSISIKYIAIYVLYILVFYWGIFTLANFKINIIKYSIRGYTFGYLLVFIWSIFKWSTYGFNPVVVPGIFEPFYADHTIYAASGVFLFLFWVFAAFDAGQKEKILAITVAIAVLMAIRVANSRAAFLSLPVGFIVVFGVLKGFRKRHLALTMAAVFALLFMYRNAIYNWISYNDYNSRDEHAGLLERTASVGNVQTDVSNLERINRWVAALNMFNEKPIIGFGPGTFQYSYIQYQDSKYMNRLSVTDVYHIPKNSGGTVHSEPLLFLSELGGLGFLAWLILIVTWIWWLLSVPKANRSIYLAVSAGMLATYLFHGLFNNFLNTDKLAFLFWGCAAIMMIELENGNKRKSIL